MNFEKFESQFKNFMSDVCENNPDPSHDILHVNRVVSLAKKIGQLEKANLDIVIPAAYLHDCVYLSKTDERRSLSSKISADHAVSLLKTWNYPEKFHAEIHHAIVAHSFSANIPTETIEAKVVQDADRLDAMGAVGIFRCFSFSGLAKKPFYFPEDPFCKQRNPDEKTNALDHFYTKLLNLFSKLNTDSARIEGKKRMETMNHFLKSLEDEISVS